MEIDLLIGIFVKLSQAFQNPNAPYHHYTIKGERVCHVEYLELVSFLMGRVTPGNQTAPEER
jgi:hypothetical protein